MFRRILERRGFLEFSRGEGNGSGLGFNLIRPKSRSYQEPGEVCLVFKMPPQSGNDYQVVVMTTKRRDGWVSRDSGFVIILDGAGNRVHTSRPTVRNQPGFLWRLLEDVYEARYRVMYRPSHCEKLMNASHRHRTKEEKEDERYWRASFWRCSVHPEDKKHCRSWDDLREPLPPKMAARIRERRKQHAKDNKRLRAKGGKPYAALRKRIRHPWKKVLVKTTK